MVAWPARAQAVAGPQMLVDPGRAAAARVLAEHRDFQRARDKQKVADVIRLPDDLVQEIVAIPAGALCSEKIVRASAEPCRPEDVSVTALHGKARRQLVISDDGTALVANMRTAVANALCDFSYAFIDKGGEETKTVLAPEWVCGVTKRFVSGP